MGDKKEKGPEIKKHKNRKVLYVLIIGIFISVVFSLYTTWREVIERQDETQNMLEVYKIRIEALLDSLFHKTDVLESIIITSKGKVPEETFNDLAKSLLDGVGIRAIQYLPDGVTTYCYPLEGNQAAIGNNVFENPDRKEDALLAKETKNITISGPYILLQGGIGLIARNPIFLTDENGKENFWGFSVIILDLPDALNPILLNEIERVGYEYLLNYKNESGEYEEIAKSKDFQNDYAVHKEIEVPNHIWNLSIGPKDGWVSWWMIVIRLIVGGGITMLCVIIVSLTEKTKKQLEQFAETDALTGLYNRRRLKEYLDIRCQDRKIPFVMFYMDLNKFKEINDTFGHLWGDVVLKDVAKRIQGCIGKEDFLVRMGGDEFLAIIEHKVSEEECQKYSKRIKESVGERFILDGKERFLSISIGCSNFPEEGENFTELIEKADMRMYEEKRGSKERIETEKMKEE